MFRRLISNLPYNPSLISQVTFYAGRVRQERAIRRLSMILMSLTLTIQTFAFIRPPERSLATSSNHIINGIRTRSDILSAWDQANSDIPAIYGRFGLTRSDITNLSEKPNVTIRSTDADYWTIGRNSLLGYSGVKEEYKSTQLSIQYSGKDTEATNDDQFVYQRPLKAWDIRNSFNTYKAFKGTIASTGETFWILQDCGNFTKIDKSKPIPEPKPEPVKEQPKTKPEPKPDPKHYEKPKLEIKKTIENKPEFMKPGDTLTFHISFRNAQIDTLAENVVIEDQFDSKYFSIANIETDTFSVSNGFFRYKHGSLGYSTHYTVLPVKVQLKDQISSGTNVCNQARIIANNASATSSNDACVGVIVPCPFDSNISDVNNPNCTEPKLTCSVLDTNINRTTRTATFKTTATSTNPANTQIIAYEYDFGDETTKRFDTTTLSHETSHTYETGSYTVKAKVIFRTTGQKLAAAQEATCTSDINFESDQPLGQSKTVRNITQNATGTLAETTTVKAGDVLEYTLTTSNSQNYERPGQVITDYIGDLLDYSTLDTAHLAEQGGTFESATSKIHFKDIKIAANSSVTQTFRVTIKDPIPTTNQPGAANTTHDCKISNEYGNQITINISCPLVKGIETLPNTGPGIGMFVVTLTTTIIGFFYARSRLLAKELEIIRTDYARGNV